MQKEVGYKGKNKAGGKEGRKSRARFTNKVKLNKNELGDKFSQ